MINQLKFSQIQSQVKFSCFNNLNQKKDEIKSQNAQELKQANSKKQNQSDQLQIQTKNLKQHENLNQYLILNKQKQKIDQIQQIPQNVNPKKVQIVAVSDNHGNYKNMNKILAMKGDIFIHGGDFTAYGNDKHFKQFFQFLSKLNFKHKIVIYLQHQAIQLEGIKIFASPFTPEYCEKPNGRAFQYKPHHQKAIWKVIPEDCQLLLTHGPPFGILDAGKGGKHAGSQYLKQVVEVIKPRYHIFGHIHESTGMMKVGDTFFLNLCNSPTRIIM